MSRMIVIVCLLILLMPAALFAQEAVAICAPSRPAARLGQTAQQIESSGVMRDYLLYVPTTYDATTPTPLVLSFHGRSSNGLQQSVLSGWNLVAEREGILVAYPNALGTPSQWNTTPPTRRRPNDDLTFVTDLMDTLTQQYCLDASRIYVNGMSNGGGMSNLLACTLSERITAMGGVAGAYIGTERRCNPTRPVPVIAFHGTADTVVTYEGGPSQSFDYDFPSVPGWAADWAAHNGCDATPVKMPTLGDASAIRYKECDESAAVILYTIEDGGHTWPGGFPVPALGKTSTDVSATETMWAFFAGRRLESE